MCRKQPRPSRSKPEESATKRSFAAEDFAAKVGCCFQLRLGESSVILQHAEKELRRQRQRTAVLNELISTEQAYVEDLGIIVIEVRGRYTLNSRGTDSGRSLVAYAVACRQLQKSLIHGRSRTTVFER